MKLQQLIYFVEVCNNGSISKASSRLYVSQPSISSAIKELERTCNTILFRRVNKKLYITPEGQYLYERANVIIKEMEQLKEELHTLSLSKRSIKLGLPMQVSSFLLPKLLGEFSDANPDINLEIIELPSLDLLELLEGEQLDIAIMASEEAQHYQVTFQTLFNSEFSLFLHPDNPLAQYEAISIEQVGDTPFALPSRTHIIHGAVLQRFTSAKCRPNVIMQSTNLHTIASLISHNLSSAFLLRETDLGPIEHKKISIDPPLCVQVSIATAKGIPVTQQIQTLLDYLTANWK